MQQILLDAKVRNETGTGISRRLRRQGRVPAIVYGRKENPLTLEVMEKEFAKVVGLATGQNVIISLNLDKDGSEILALVKDVQYHPVTDKLLHVDFYRISLRDKITVSVAVVVTGESLGVKKGGILEHILWQVEVECLPTQIPDRIEVDITALNIGDTVHVKDLKLGEGINILTEGEQTILSVVPPTVVKEGEEVAEEKAAEPERIGGKEKEESVEEGKASKSEERKEEGSEKKAPKK
ncbi:MAG: 50S ribosomal protein L25/general stress protein Ctc [Nitrospirae bacterium]|nr:50S ribosomal protein L25/general stress protein Ctc [Nitrospirota bacterium]